MFIEASFAAPAARCDASDGSVPQRPSKAHRCLFKFDFVLFNMPLETKGHTAYTSYIGESAACFVLVGRYCHISRARKSDLVRRLQVYEANPLNSNVCFSRNCTDTSASHLRKNSAPFCMMYGWCGCGLTALQSLYETK